MLLPRQDDGASDAVGVAVEIFGRAVHDDVGPEVERSLQAGRQEGVVDHAHEPARAAERRDLRDVREDHHRVGRRLHVHHAGVLPDRLLDGVHPGGVDIGEGESVILEDAGEQPVGAAVDVLAHHDVVACLHQGHHGADRRHAGGERVGRPASLQGLQVGFQGRAGRVDRPRIVVSGAPAGRFVDVRGGLIDRGHDRARRGVGHDTRVDGVRGESHHVTSS